MSILRSLSVLCLLVQASHGRPSLVPGSDGIRIPIFKRASALDAASSEMVANFTLLERHLEQVEAKYQQGLSNWQANTGAMKFRSDEDSEATQASQDGPGGESSDLFPLLSAGPAALSPSPSDPSITAEASRSTFDASAVRRPEVKKFQYLPQTSGLARHRKIFKAKQAESLNSYHNDQLWAGEITIGSNQQPFLIDFDT
jgi:hypothetical protein